MWFLPSLLSEQAKEEIATCIADGFLFGHGGFTMSPDSEMEALTAKRIDPVRIRMIDR